MFMGNDPIKLCELRQPQCCLHVGNAEIEANVWMHERSAVASPLVAQKEQPLVVGGIAADDVPALAGCNGLVGEEGKTPEVAKGTCVLAVVAHAKCLGRVFNHQQVVLSAKTITSVMFTIMPYRCTGMIARVRTVTS